MWSTAVTVISTDLIFLIFADWMGFNGLSGLLPIESSYVGLLFDIVNITKFYPLISNVVQIQFFFSPFVKSLLHHNFPFDLSQLLFLLPNSFF